MNWKTTVAWLITTVLIAGPGQAKNKAKDPTYFKSNISTRFIKPLSENVSQFLSPEFNPMIDFRAQLPETLSVMAIRVQFQLVADRTTTGNGWFDMGEVDSIMVNPPPHDYDYFANQLKALKHYFESVSRKKLILNIAGTDGKYFVFPQQNDSVWTLHQPMAYYNPNTTEDELDQRLAELFRDAIEIADQNSEIDFSQFDVFIIFHAGVGWEFTQEFDTTPSDIPSVFLNLDDLKTTIGGNTADFRGIAVNDGTYFVPEGIILPETESQGGYEFGLLGTAAIMFGHQLGLPSLFDTETGRPGIGRFGLMDQGSGSFSGLIPVQPCAWSKIFLGWEEPVLTTGGKQLPLAASLARHPNKIYKIPINAREYFLIENRQRAVLKSRSVAVGYDNFRTRIEFTDDGNIILPPEADRLGVIVQIDEYDFGLPGAGILIWHIDEDVIQSNYAVNRVNVNINHRGVDLVEADGAQDIGYFFNFFGITGFESGNAYDMWWSGNEDHKFANNSETVMFTPETMPSSNAHSGANSGVYITEFSDRDSVMFFTLELKQFQAGFPLFLGDKSSGKSAALSSDLDQDGERELIVAAGQGKILAWHADGAKFIDNDDVIARVEISGDTTYTPLAVFASVDNEQFLLKPAAANLNQDGKVEVVAVAESGRLYVWQPIDVDQNGRADLLFSVDLGSSPSTPPIIGSVQSGDGGMEIFLGLTNGNIACVSTTGQIRYNKHLSDNPITGIVIFTSEDGAGLVATSGGGELLRTDDAAELVWKKNLASSELNPPVVGDVNRDSKFEIIVSSTDGRLFIMDDSGNRPDNFSDVYLNCRLSAPVLADVNRNGYLDVVLVGGGKIFAFHNTGAPVTNFPMQFERTALDTDYPPPVVADVDADGFPEIFVATASNKVLAFDMNGSKNESFPLSISGAGSAALGLHDLNGDGKFDLYARSDDGYLYSWHLAYTFEQSRLLWGEYLKDATNNGLYHQQVELPVRQGMLLPEKSVYNYPNPTEGNSTVIRYYLRDAARVTIRIYDMAGELVQELEGSGFEAMDNEVSWDLSGVQSGVYLARVKAESSTETNSAIIKIAVIK